MLRRLIAPVTAYTHWLHGRWPAGRIERLPDIRDDGSTNVPGLFIVGDLTGIPLLKFSVDSGARAVRTIARSDAFHRERGSRPEGVVELAIVGAGVSGMSAALEGRRLGLDVVVIEARRPFQTIADFPNGKPIYTYPQSMTPAGSLHVGAEVKEDLLDELEQQTSDLEVREGTARAVRRRDGLLHVELDDGETVRALRAIVAIGRSGNYRELGVPGEDLNVVHNRLHDPADFAERRALVVGGGDSALETAVALDNAGAEVTLSYRGPSFSRPKADNLAALGAGSVEVLLGSEVLAIEHERVRLRGADDEPIELDNDVVFSMIGREAPLEFFRRSGVRIRGEWSAGRVVAMVAVVLAFLALYNWKSGGLLDELTREAGAFPYSLADWASSLPADGLLGIAARSATGPAFWYTLAYSTIVVVFGLRRIRRRRTPYVTLQTLTLMAIQVLPLFLLPEILLPWMDAHGWLPASIADALFPRVNYGHGREFWRAYGLVLAWPLNVYNVFTEQPLWAWLGICFVQTFVLIPLLIRFWGKGAYCGWICSCGAMAETLGDGLREKMPHGPRWNRVNMAGQLVLVLAFVLLGLRIAGWIAPDFEPLRRLWDSVFTGSAVSWKWTVDVLLAGALGYGLYFWLSGRVWCRFFCPLAALMHVYARFSRFRILADKKKCISCNVCTSVCHQGIDVMNFANKGLPMADPQCVRCSACVQSCPTGVLSFGRVDSRERKIAGPWLAASPVRMRGE